MSDSTQQDADNERRTVDIIREIARREAEALIEPLRRRIAELEERLKALEIAGA